MSIDYRALADGVLNEPELPDTEAPPTSCSYCGGTEFDQIDDTGRGQRATCASCGGTMSSSTGYWQPELIGSPKNHPKMSPDPASGGVGGVWAPVLRREDLGDHRTAMPSRKHTPPDGLAMRVRHHGEDDEDSDEYFDHDSRRPGWSHHTLEARLPGAVGKPSGVLDYSTRDDDNPTLTVHFMHVRQRDRSQGIASAMQDHLRELHPQHMFDHGSRTPSGHGWAQQYEDPGDPRLDLDHSDNVHVWNQHVSALPGSFPRDRRELLVTEGASDWCRHRHAEHCWLPRNDTNGATALYVPQDRGRCPWTVASQQQINCPVSEPGPMAGMAMTGARGGLPEDAEFHFTPAQADRRSDHHELAMHSGGGEVGKLSWGHDGDISGVDTHHRYRRRGIGTALYTKAHELSRQHGLQPPNQSVFQTPDGHGFRQHFDAMEQRPDVSNIETHVHRGKGEDDTDLHAHLIEHHYKTSPDLVHSWDQETAERVHDKITQFDSCGWRKTSMIGDPELRLHMLATWTDVRNKAKRIRAEGGVNVLVSSYDGVGGNVQGEHNVYETVLNYLPGSRKVASWTCGCAWAAYAWGRSPAYRRFEGRMCSHALALQFEAQARGMFGREVEPDTQRPAWLRSNTPVQVRHDRDTGKGERRRAVPPGNMRRTFEGSLDEHRSDHALDLVRPPVYAFVVDALSQGSEPSLAMTAMLDAGMPHPQALSLLHEALADPGSVPAAGAVENGTEALRATSGFDSYGEWDGEDDSYTHHVFHEPHHVTAARHDPMEDTWWHGTATGDMRGGHYGLHVGTHKAATEAVTAAIGHPAEGTWDGSRTYGETVLAGKHTLRARGIWPTGYSSTHAPDHDHLPTGGANFQGGSRVPLDAKPDIFPVQITGRMGNTPDTPHKDFEANARMKRSVGDGGEGHGYYYRNVAEDPGSISAVLPGRNHVERIGRNMPGHDYRSGEKYHQPLTDADHDFDEDSDEDSDDDWHHHGAKAASDVTSSSIWVNSVSTPPQPGSSVPTASGEGDDGPTHAGLVLKAQDTGRILMLQRSHKDESDPARGTWEFPGGGIEPHDSSSVHAAAREFAEEVGQRVPHGGTLQHVWRSGPYQGHVLVIPREDQITLHDGRVVPNPDDPKGDDAEQAAWWHPEHAQKNPALRQECRSAPWKQIKAASRGKTSSHVAPGDAVGDLADGLMSDAVHQPDNSARFASSTTQADVHDDLWGELGVGVVHAQQHTTASTSSFDHVGHVAGVVTGTEMPEVLARRVVAGMPGHGLSVIADEVSVPPLVRRDETRRTAGQVGAVPEAPVTLLVDRRGPRVAGVDPTADVDLRQVPSFRRDESALRHGAKVPMTDLEQIWRQADFAAHDPLGDFSADPPAQRPSNLPGDQENPGSTGFATAADPPAFDAADSRTMRMPEMSSWGSLADEYPAPPTIGERARAYLHTGELHDPEPALPATTADDEDNWSTNVDPAHQHIPSDVSGGMTDPRDDMRPEIDPLESVNPNSVHASVGSVDDIVARFQATAGARLLAADTGNGGGGGPSDADIAGAAKAHLAKTALKDFSYAEQQELIGEGAAEKTRARNLSDLQIEGTHYAALEEALAAQENVSDTEVLFV